MELIDLNKLFGRRVAKSVSEPKPEPKIVNPWPDGKKTVNVHLWRPLGDIPAGRATFTLMAFTSGEEPRYRVFGKEGSWRESVLRDAVVQGVMAVLPDEGLGIDFPDAK